MCGRRYRPSGCRLFGCALHQLSIAEATLDGHGLYCVRGDANSGMADAGCGAEQDHALLCGERRRHLCHSYSRRQLLAFMSDSLVASGKVALSRTKFGGMAVPAAQLDLGRPFQEKLSCPFDERREIFVCEDGALVPEQISFKFHFR